MKSCLDWMLPYLKNEKKWSYEQIKNIGYKETIRLLKIASQKYSDPEYDALAKVVDSLTYQSAMNQLTLYNNLKDKDNNIPQILFRTKTLIESENFRKDLFGIESMPVSIAPPRQSLKVLGGYLTIEEFRREFFILNKNIIHLCPTVAPVRNLFEEEYHDKMIRMNSTGVRARLKRNTPAPQI
jgi:hypothetical protein